MSDLKNAQNEETFTSKLDIQMVTPRGYERIIEMHASTPRAVVTAIGMPGLGKTAIPKQVARKRGARYQALHGPTLRIEDLGIPTTAVDTKQYYDMRIPRKFQPLIDYVVKMREENGGVFPEGKNPILAIEELNRTTDKHVTRALFTLIEDRMVGDVYLDEAIQIVVTMNPSGGAMAVNEFERDPAHRRRLVMVGITASYGDFLRYAREANFHPKVIEHLEAQPTWLYDHDAMKAGKKFACPSSWETLSQACKAYDAQKIPLHDETAVAAFAGMIGSTASEAFVEFVRDATVVITPDEVLQGYSKNSTVRQRFNKLVEESRMDKISSLTSGLAMKIYATPQKPTAFAKQLALFMDDLPEDVLLAFIKEVVDQAKAVSNGAARRVEFNQLIAQDAAFNNAMEKLKRAQQKAQDAAKREGA